MSVILTKSRGLVKKVLIITYYWPPSGGAGVQRWLNLPNTFPDMDVEPYVLTVDQKLCLLSPN
jgi:hypothetical protein